MTDQNVHPLEISPVAAHAARGRQLRDLFARCNTLTTEQRALKDQAKDLKRQLNDQKRKIEAMLGAFSTLEVWVTAAVNELSDYTANSAPVVKETRAALEKMKETMK